MLSNNAQVFDYFIIFFVTNPETGFGWNKFFFARKISLLVLNKYVHIYFYYLDFDTVISLLFD